MPRFRKQLPAALVAALTTVVASVASLSCAADGIDEPRRIALHTFSICAIDPRTGESGVAVTTRVPQVGRLCPFAKAGVGAVATQSFVEVSYGPHGLELLEQGHSPEETIELLLRDDPQRETRQLGIIDARGATAQFTGSQCFDYAGQRAGKNYVTQGNLLAGRAVIDAVADAFESLDDADWPLADRLITALEAGQAAGGDKRTGLKQSAALVVADPRDTFIDGSHLIVNLQVAEHPEPVAELRRQYDTIHGRPGFRELRWIQGRDVAELQTWLRELGYIVAFADEPAGASGPRLAIFDEATVDAVDRFRHDHGLPTQADRLGHERGIVDRACVEKLKQELTRVRRDKRSEVKRDEEARHP